VLGPVDRVDDPAGARPAVRAELLADDAVAGALDGHAGADGPHDRAVGLGHRAEVRLGLDDQVVGPEAGKTDAVGLVGQLQGESEFGVHGPDTTGWRGLPGQLGSSPRTSSAALTNARMSTEEA